MWYTHSTICTSGKCLYTHKLSLLVCREYEIARQNNASWTAQVRGSVAALYFCSLFLGGEKYV